MPLATVNWAVVPEGSTLILLSYFSEVLRVWVIAIRACSVRPFILVSMLQAFCHHIEYRAFALVVEDGASSYTLTRYFLR